MVNIRNAKRKNAFKHTLFRKSFGYLATLGFILILFIATDFAAAYSIGVSPGKIVFDSNEKKQITLFNQNSIAVSYLIDGSEQFSIMPARGTISPLASEKIVITPKKAKEAESAITVRFATEKGTVLPEAIIKLTTTKGRDYRILISIAVFLAGAAIVFYLRRHPKEIQSLQLKEAGHRRNIRAE